MIAWDKLVRSAAKSALQFRAKKRLGWDTPCDIYKVIADEGIDLQFVDVPSLEGMFLQEPEVTRVCVCSHRPWGRQRFTAAHELGHCIMGHGTQVDMLVESRNLTTLSDEEVLVDGFARYLLMPPRAVDRAFGTARDYSPTSVYKASCWLGVGFSTLVEQMFWSLQLISKDQHDDLLKCPRQQLTRAIISDPSFKGDAWVLDDSWADRTMHVQIGDVLLGASTGGGCVLSTSASGLARVIAVGTESVLLPSGLHAIVCASRRNYIGHFEYRYLAEE
jgi:hypothetical protein